MTETRRQGRFVENHTGHRAVEAWRRLDMASGEVESVQVLKESKPKKSRVYRLIGAGPDGESVIAKRCRPTTAVLEQEIYQKVLPRLPLPQLRFYGTVADMDPANRWIFLEDVGDTEIEEVERERAVQWLACFHTSAASLVDPARFADRGLVYHAEQLDHARRQMLIGLTLPSFTGECRRVLQDTLALLEAIERRWTEIEGMYARLRMTLIHGDFVCKNVRARSTSLVRELCVLDWEQAGWGITGSDLVTLAREHADMPERSLIEAYVDAVRFSRRCGIEEMEAGAYVGMVFRSIRRTAVNGHSITVGPVGWLMDNLRVTAQRCHSTLRAMGWIDS